MINIKNEAKKYLLELEKIDFSDINNILFWIYSIKENISMLDDYAISKYVFDIIKEKHFNNNYNVEEDIKNANFLTSDNPNINNVLLSLLMYSLDKNEGISNSLVFAINNYVETYMESKSKDLMMSNLNNNINKNVTISGIKDNDYYIESGVLESINNDDYIKLNDNKYQFISDNEGIIKIVSNDTGYELYHNGHVRNFTNKLNYDIMQSQKEKQL